MTSMSYRARKRRYLELNPLCDLCSSAPSEHVHHVIPVALGIDPEDQSNWSALCRPCHQAVHAATRHVKKGTFKWQKRPHRF